MKRIRLFTHPLAAWLILGAVGFIGGVILAACQSSGIVCSAGLSRCGLGCADFKSDSQNCGACGVACQSLQICQESACQCRPGATQCGSSCVVTSSDPQNCGGCINDGGFSCSASQVCNQGQCADRCTPDGGLTACAQGCVDIHTDPLNCGQCGNTCLTGQSCRDGGTCSSDVVAACYNTGHVVGLQAGPDVISEAKSFGTNPQALAATQGVLLSADGHDQRLNQMSLKDFSLLTNVTPLGVSPNHILVDDQYIYVVNSSDDNLQVLRRMGVDAGDAGLSLLTVGQLPFGMNTFPQSIAKSGTRLYIALLGGAGAVAEVDISTPSTPVLVRTLTFSSSPTDLRPFNPAVPTFARPSGIALFQGSIYVALSNLDASFRVGGPGLLAQVNLTTWSATYMPLPSTCLDPLWVVASSVLYVSCAGRAQYDSLFHLIGIDSSGAVAVAADGGMTSWNGSCDGGCFAPAVGRFAVLGNRLYLGDQLGRMFVIENVDGGFVERRGYNLATGGLPISACPTSASGYANVNDVIAVP